MTAAKKPLEGKVLPPVGALRLPGVDAVQALGSLVDSTLAFLQVREEERTKRAGIEAYETLEVSRIREAGSLLRNYFDHVFAERAQTIDGLFDRLDEAVTRGDGPASAAAVQGIVDLAKSSPLADISDLSQVRKALDDPNHVWEF